jgi:hypothetical protein
MASRLSRRESFNQSTTEEAAVVQRNTVICYTMHSASSVSIAICMKVS